MLRLPFFLAVALVGSCLVSCSDSEAEASTSDATARPGVVEPHPLMRVELAAESPETSLEELWRLGVEVFGWNPSELPADATREDLVTWVEEDLRLVEQSDWPFETARPLARGSSHDWSSAGS